MTVPTSTAKSGPYAGAGTTGPFTVGFRFLENSHLQVIKTSTLGVNSTLTLTSDYTVAGAGGASGSITLVTALAVGEKLTVIRNVPFTQLADYVQNDAFPAESHERALDQLTMQVQQVAEAQGRALTLPATSSGASTELPSPEANKVIGWNETGSGLANLDAGKFATIVAYGTAKSDIFTGDGVTTAFGLTVEPGSLNNLDVAIGGVTQLPGVDYTWTSGTVVTFTSAPPLGAKVLIRYMQGLPFGTANASDVVFDGGGTVADLRGSAGSSLVGFQQAGAGAVATSVKAELDVVKALQPGDFDLSWLITKDGSKVVITGDSISFNNYDFGTSYQANAYDCLPGLMSWSFMLRDFIHRADPWFIHADQLDFTVANGGGIGVVNGASPYTMPFNNRYVAIQGTGATSEVRFFHRVNNEQSGKMVLHCASNQTSDDCLVDVYWSVSPFSGETLAGTLDAKTGTNYQGFEPFTFEIPCGGSSNFPVQIRFTNFRLRNGSPIPSGTRRFFLQAAGSKNTTVRMTGAGGWRTANLLSDFTNRIGTHQPDLLVMILGANDRFYGTKEEYAAGLTSIINATRAIKPHCQIVCLTAMPASDAGYAPNETLNGSTMRDFLETAKRAVLGAGAYFFDNYELFRSINPTEWRFDNVHLSKRGNKMLFDALAGRYFAAAYGSKEYYDPTLQANTPTVFQENRTPAHGYVAFSFNSATNTYTINSSSDPEVAVRSITRVQPYALRVSFNYNINASLGSGPKVGPITLTHTGSSAYWINTRRGGSFGDDFVDFFLIDQLSNTLLTDAMNNGQNYVLSF